MFDQVETSDFSKGTFALHGLQKVEIIGVNLLEKTRHIAWTEFGENGETKRWVSVDALKPLPKPFVPKMAVIEAAVLAGLEAMPSGSSDIDIPALVERVVNGGVAADAAAEVQAAQRHEWEIADEGIIAATGERVQIVGTDLFSQRKVKYLDLEGIDPHWLDIRELKPITAVLEMDLAKQRDELQAQLKQKDELIAGLRRETEASSDQADKILREYDGKLKDQLDLNKKLKADLDAETEKLRKAALRINELREAEHQRSKGLDGDDYDQLEHLIMHSNAELLDRIKALEAAAAKPPRRKIQSWTIRNVTDTQIEKFINDGWTVAFETVVVMTSSGDWGPVDDDCHIIRFEREAPEETPSPLEEHADDGLPTYEEIMAEEAAEKASTAARDSVVVDVEVPDLVPQPVMLIDEPAPLPTMVRVGNVLIDPVKMPYAATLAMGVTAEELINKLNEQVKQKVMTKMTSLPQRPTPVPLLLGQPQP